MSGERPASKMTEGQAAVRRLVVLGAALVVLLLVGGVVLLAAGSRALDNLQARQDQILAGNVLRRSLTRMVGDMTSATVWDQAYRELRPGGDLSWADKEIGTYFANNRGNDRTVAIDGADRPFYAWNGQHRADPARQAGFLAAVAPLVRRARLVEAQRDAMVPLAPPTTPSLAETASGLVMFDGAPYLVAASTVTPEEALARRTPGPSVLVVSAQRLDRQIPGLLEGVGLSGAHFAPHAGGASNAMLLAGADGRALGALIWSAKRPGVDVLMQAAPALVLGFGVTALLTGALGWEIWRVAARLAVHERAHDEALRALAEARDRAESANVAKSQFLANMSHEIRTPLNGVLGMAQVLSRSDLAAEDREKVDVIRASGETLLGLLNDLLDLSKIEAGRMEVDLHDFDLAETVAIATRPFATLAAQKDVRFLVEIGAGAEGIWRGDGGKVGQVVANLASNAVKFTTSGEVRVAVRRTDDGIACTVADTGAGIARERLAELFLRFSQVDPTATRKHGGTGLGLAITRELVELMGGRVSVTSVEGRGSAFSFELPLTWVGPCADRGEPACAQPELRPIQVLAAEDNKTNQLLLTAMLEPMGVRVRLTGDGAEALRVFKEEPFDLVLMDIQMPVMNGVDATRAMRAFEAAEGRRPTPILALSANVMRHQVDEYLAAGMNGFVAKPIEMAALVAAIEQALAEAPADGVAAA